MAMALGIRPRASIDDARPILFYGDEQPETTFGRDQMQGRPQLRYDMKSVNEPGMPVNGLPGATSVDDYQQSPTSGGVVSRRSVKERPQLRLGDILPQRTPVSNAPTYQKKDKYSVWDRVKAALGGARYNAGGGLPGMIGGALGGAVHPDQIDKANFATGPYAEWQRKAQAARGQDDRNMKDAMTRLQMAKILSDINKGNEPKPLKQMTNLPHLGFLDEDANEVVIPNGADGQPIKTSATVTAESNHEFQLQKLEDQQSHQVEMLSQRLESQLELLSVRGVAAHKIEAFRQSGRVAIQTMRQRHSRERLARRRRRR